MCVRKVGEDGIWGGRKGRGKLGEEEEGEVRRNVTICEEGERAMTIHVSREQREGWGHTRTSIANVSTSRIFGSSVNGSESSKNAAGQKLRVNHMHW